MKITTPHKTVDKIKICLYCPKPLSKGIENKRGTCRTCNSKFHDKNKLTDYLNPAM